jgi:type IV pilus assembly protein PilV
MNTNPRHTGTRRRCATRATPRRGFMLMEALVALLIFSIGVLGVIGLQAAMTKSQTDSKFRADAAFLAQRLVGSMWSDRSGLDKYDTNANCASHARCSQWLSEVASQLPEGDATVAVTSLGTDASGRVIAAEVTISINWTPPSEEPRRFITTSAIAANL